VYVVTQDHKKVSAVGMISSGKKAVTTVTRTTGSRFSVKHSQSSVED